MFKSLNPETLSILSDGLAEASSNTSDLLHLGNAENIQQQNNSSLKYWMSFFDGAMNDDNKSYNKLLAAAEGVDLIVSGVGEPIDNDTNGNDWHLIKMNLGEVFSAELKYCISRDHSGYGIEEVTLTVNHCFDDDVKELIEFIWGNNCYDIANEIHSDGDNLFWDTPEADLKELKNNTVIQTLASVFDSEKQYQDKKVFLVTTNIIEGSRSVPDLSLIEAPNADIAQDYAIYIYSNNDRLEWSDKGATHESGYPAYEWAGYKEVAACDVEIMKHYHDTIHQADLKFDHNKEEWVSIESE